AAFLERVLWPSRRRNSPPRSTRSPRVKSLYRLVPALALSALLPLARSSRADDDPAPRQDAPRDTSPALPAPQGLKFIDQGKHDRRLAGYRTPEGIKVEIVAEAPVVVNPIGLTFADDGTPFVLEWVPSPGDEQRQETIEFTYKNGSKRQVALPRKRKKD